MASLLAVFSIWPSRADIITLPQDFSSVRAFPNPWRSDRHVSAVTFDHLPTSAATTLKIFTISGQHVRTLTGTQSISWDLNNTSGQRVASGVYLYLLTANGQKKIGKIAVIR